MKYYIQNNQLYKVRTALGEGYDLSETNSLEDFQAGKIITLSTEQIEFYKANRNATAKEIFDCELTVVEVPELTLEQVKFQKLHELISYDCSTEVNSFTLFGNVMWLHRDTRMSLMQTAVILEQAGHTETTLWTEGSNPQSIPVTIAALKQFLSALEIYAKQCYDITAQHKRNIFALESAQQVQEYNFVTGYPVKLNM